MGTQQRTAEGPDAAAAAAAEPAAAMASRTARGKKRREAWRARDRWPAARQQREQGKERGIKKRQHSNRAEAKSKSGPEQRTQPPRLEQLCDGGGGRWLVPSPRRTRVRCRRHGRALGTVCGSRRHGRTAARERKRATRATRATRERRQPVEAPAPRPTQVQVQVAAAEVVRYQCCHPPPPGPRGLQRPGFDMPIASLCARIPYACIVRLPVRGASDPAIARAICLVSSPCCLRRCVDTKSCGTHGRDVGGEPAWETRQLGGAVRLVVHQLPFWLCTTCSPSRATVSNHARPTAQHPTPCAPFVGPGAVGAVTNVCTCMHLLGGSVENCCFLSI